jgi:hypothetical protein
MGLFASSFGADAARQVEFSFSAAATVFGTGIPGRSREFWEQVRRFAGPFEFARSWVKAVDRLLVRLAPPAFFFKVDWSEGKALRITIYFRFEKPVSEAELIGAMGDASPLVWDGPSPHILARSLGEAGPFIVGFRTGLDGHQVAMYYRVRAAREQFLVEQLPAIVGELSLPNTVPGKVRDVLKGVIGFGAPSILGVNSRRESEGPELKLDVAGVTLADALLWIGQQGADIQRVRALATIARRMRIEVLSYCGAKIGSEGLLGWKLYMPVRPMDRVIAAPRIRIGDDQRRLAGFPW